MTVAHQQFDRVRRGAKVGIWIETAAWAAIVSVLYVFVSYGIDRWLRLEVGYRAFLLLSFVTAIVVIAYRRMVLPMRFELSDEELALAVERQDAELHQSLISAVQFERKLGEQDPDTNELGGHTAADRGESKRLMDHVVSDVARRVQALPFGRAVDRRRVGRAALTVMTALVIFGSWCLVFSDEARLWATRNIGLGSTEWPRATQLAYVDGIDETGIRVAERDDVTIRVRATGVVPEDLTLHCEFAGGETADRNMERIGTDTFTVTLETLLEDVQVFATGGDGETGILTVTLVPRPRLRDLAVHIEYPDYLDRPAATVTEFSGDVRVPRGSTLELTAKSDKPLLSATLLHGDDVQVEATLTTDGLTMTARLQPETSGVATFDALDRDRLGPSDAEVVFLQLVDDQPPRVDFATFGIGTLITPVAKIPGRLKLRDDHGLVAVDAAFRITAAVQPEPEFDDENTAAVSEPEFEPAPMVGLDGFASGTREFATDTIFDLLAFDAGASTDPIPENTRFRPGQLLALRVTSRDAFVPTPHETESETLHFRIVTREKLLEELRRRQGEQRRDLERLLKRERTLLAELQEAPLAAGTDDQANETARATLAGIARRQQALGRRTQAVANRYQRILDEFLNNRLLEPNIVRGKHSKIVSPLTTLATADFPSTSAATSALGETPDSSLKQDAVRGYGGIVRVIERVLAEMEQTEDLALLLEALRIVIKTEEQATELVEKKRNESVEDLFGPEKPGDPGAGRTDTQRKEKNP